MLARLLPWSGLFLAVLLSACGGDNASESAPASDANPTESANSPTEVTGRAAKGILRSARVDAYALENGQHRHLDGTVTNDSGDFSLELSGLNQPVLLEVTPAGDGSTRMVCDAVDGCGSTDFGGAVALSGDFRLTALVAPDELDQGAVAITPLTHMAAEWARSLPRELNAEMMKMARRKVGGCSIWNPGLPFSGCRISPVMPLPRKPTSRAGAMP